MIRFIPEFWLSLAKPDPKQAYQSCLSIPVMCTTQFGKPKQPGNRQSQNRPIIKSEILVQIVSVTNCENLICNHVVIFPLSPKWFGHSEIWKWSDSSWQAGWETSLREWCRFHKCREHHNRFLHWGESVCNNIISPGERPLRILNKVFPILCRDEVSVARCCIKASETIKILRVSAQWTTST